MEKNLQSKFDRTTNNKSSIEILESSPIISCQVLNQFQAHASSSHMDYCVSLLEHQGLYIWHLLHHDYLILYQALLYEFKVKSFFHILGKEI